MKCHLLNLTKQYPSIRDDSSSSLSEEEVPDFSRELKDGSQNSWEENSSSSSDVERDVKDAKKQTSKTSQLNQHMSGVSKYDQNREANSNTSSSNSSAGSESSDSSDSDSGESVHNNKRRQRKHSQKDTPWEDNPDIYGVRRSNRARKEPQRLVVQSGSEDSEDNQKKIKKNVGRKRNDSYIPTLSGSESEDSDSSFDVPQYRQKPRRNVNNPSTKKRKQQRGRPMSTSSGEYQVSRGKKSRVGTSSTRHVNNKISYKEETEDETDSDDLIDQDEDTLNSAPAEEVETIEKIMRHRRGRPGLTGAKTTIYAEEAKEISKLTDPDPNNEETELQFLIKWKSWSNLHNTWETKETLTKQNVGGIKKLENYIKRLEQIEDWKRIASPEDIEYFEMQTEMNEDLQKQYQNVERIIAHQFTGDSSSSYPDYLCKWQGLPYSDCTFEDGELTARFFQSYIDEYLERERSDTIPNKNAKCLRHRPKFVPLKKQPSFLGNADLQLRDYQLDGLNWLAHSWCRELSVILADEMGLGKTIQTISFLSYLFHTHQLFGPFLVVVPLSTMDAWQREFALWGVDMNVIVYIGDVNSRNKIRDHEWCHAKSRKLKFNVLLTTYEMLLRDKELLGSLSWACLLIDEAHRLKNDDSLLYRILIDFRTNFRLLITGTPLQNSLKELWSLMHFIMPNKFDRWEDFESEYTIQDKEGLQKLHHDLEPYLLRRVKKDVEKSLPAKVEQILRMEMSTVQKEYYKLILTKNVKELCKELKGSFGGLLNIIVELKKCCNHSNLIKPLDPTIEHPNLLQTIIKGSGKMILLDKLLSRLKDSGHRVLIFSQMVRMLDIIADYLYLKRYAFQRLDGSIRGEQRTRALDHFNAAGSQDFCFLLSTRAGGLGINLASADTVIIFDSDWNPQNDLQAMARAHRIGQKNKVNIYRFVTKNTIEEDIIERAKKKMVLDHLIIQRMDTTGRRVLSKSDNRSATNTSFNKEELSSILKFGAEDLFKDSEDDDQKLQAMDIDEILLRAETQETNEGPAVGEDLLSQFKVVNYAAFNEEEIKIEPPSNPINKLWEEIIPEEDRKRIEEEEEREKKAQLQLKPRSRKAVEKMNISLPTSKKVKSKAIVETDFSSSSDSEELEDENLSKEKKVIKKRTKADVCNVKGLKGFTNPEIRRFIKSYKKFARPLTRLDSIAEDAELTDKSTSELKELAELLKSSCEQAVKKYQDKLLQDEQFDGKTKGASLKIAGATINAPSVLKSEQDLEVLALHLPTDAKQQKTYRLTIPTRSVHWGLSWGVIEDSMLLVGMLVHGVGNWEAIKDDKSLMLANKILPVGNSKPQDKHLQSRAEYLLKILREHCDNNVKKETKKKTKSEGKAKLGSSKSPVPEAENSKPSRNRTVMKNRKQEIKVKEKKEKTSKKKEKMTEGVSSVIAEESVDIKDMREEMDEKTFQKCKEKMRPEKKSLQLLQTPDEKATSQEQVQTTKRCLLKIGDHIERCLQDYSNVAEELDEWRSSLWSFVSKFTELAPSKLFKLYRTAHRKRGDRHIDKKIPLNSGNKTKGVHANKQPPTDRKQMEEARQRTLGIKTSSLPGKIPKLIQKKGPKAETNINNNMSRSLKQTSTTAAEQHDKQENYQQRNASFEQKNARSTSHFGSKGRHGDLFTNSEVEKSGGKVQTYKEWKEAQIKRKLEQDEKPAQKENRQAKKPYRDKPYVNQHGDKKKIASDEKPPHQFDRHNKPRYNRDREQVVSPPYTKSPNFNSPYYGVRKRTSSNNSDLSSSTKRPYFDEDSSQSNIANENR